jgi:MFS transporter, OFA family, oxalate/formate antiporter
MKKYLTVLASFIIMLCIGSIYAWSIIASELIEKFKFSTFQSQVIFGTVIAVFPVTMIFVGQLSKKISFKYLGYISGLLFFTGYFIAGNSQGNFAIVFLGIGVFAGIATGFGYWVALTSPAQWFPEKKGLITGIAAAGFGLGAVLMSEMTERILNSSQNVLQLLKIAGISYGLIIFILSNLIYQIQNSLSVKEEPVKIKNLLSSKISKELFLGIFLGTFSGLLIIGSLKIIGGQYNISNHYLILGVSLFAIANFLGRLIWGILSDYIGASLSIFLALIFQSISIILLNIIDLSNISYLILALLIGFCFGGNFVLFAKETAQVFGVCNLGIIYPYIFLGYSLAGITGPIAGGFLFDISSTFFYPIFLASIMSFAGSLLFLKKFIVEKTKVSNNIDIAAKYIKEGKLVAFPTETVYGLGANALNPLAVAKIFEVKERPSFDPLIVHIADLNELKNLVLCKDERIYRLAEKFWPGPLTMVLPKSNIVPDIVTSGLPTVGIRMPNNIIALDLIKKSECPIAAPSANKFGRISPTTTSHIRKQLANIDYILEGGKTTVGIESTIIRLTQNGFQILRNGIITQEEIETIIPFDNIAKIESISAPGMLKSHYSPKKKLLIADDKTFNIDKSKAGLISFSGELENGYYKVIRVSEKKDLKDYAVNMFEAMHFFEDDNEIETIIAEPVDEIGIGMAIMDRLKKAEQAHLECCV